MNFLNNIFGVNKKTNTAKLALDGEFFMRKGNFKKALEKFNLAISLEPDNDMFYISRSAVKAHMRDKQGALEDVEIAILLKPSVNMYKKFKEKLEMLK